MSDKGKRSFTIPIMLIIMMVMVTFIVIAYSKFVLSEQQQKTDQGQLLAERYNDALLFAERLHDATEGLLSAKPGAEKLQVMRMLGEANFASGKAKELFVEAANLKSGLAREEVSEPLAYAFNRIIGADSVLMSAGLHEGPLTKEEVAALTVIRDGAEKMSESLERFRAPTGEAGYRQMVNLENWVGSAMEASDRLEQIAAEINK